MTLLLRTLAVAVALASLACEGPREASPAGPLAEGAENAPPDDCGAEAAPEGLENPAWRLCISPADLARLDADVFADVEVPATLVEGGRRHRIAVEYQGARTRKFPKRSFKLKFSKGAPFTGDPFGDGWGEGTFDSLVLKAMWLDRSLIREALAFRVHEALGGVAPRVGFVHLVLGDDYRGLYAIVERVDEDFVVLRGLRSGGGLYKAVNQRAHLDPGSDLSLGFEKMEARSAPWDELFDLIERLHATEPTAEALTAEVDPHLPLEQWTRRMMWIAYTQNLDGMTHNYYLYAEPAAVTGGAVRWAVLPWDSDVSFGNDWREGRDRFPIEEKHLLVGRNWLSRRLMGIDVFRAAHVAELEARLDDVLSPDAVADIALALHERVAADLLYDDARWGRPQDPADELAEILDFIDRRPAYLRSQLERLRDDPHLPDPYIHGL